MFKKICLKITGKVLKFYVANIKDKIEPQQRKPAVEVSLVLRTLKLETVAGALRCQGHLPSDSWVAAWNVEVRGHQGLDRGDADKIQNVLPIQKQPRVALGFIRWNVSEEHHSVQTNRKCWTIYRRLSCTGAHRRAEISGSSNARTPRRNKLSKELVYGSLHLPRARRQGAAVKEGKTWTIF